MAVGFIFLSDDTGIVDRKTDNVEIKELEISGRTHHRDKTCEEIKLKMMSVLFSVRAQLGVWSGTNNILELSYV